MKKIIHIDMDYFYAQVELLDRPELRHKPIAIGGMGNGRGVLCTSNYIARKFGVFSAMPTAFALKKCPSLILIHPDFKKYKKISEVIFKIYEQFSSKIEKLSLDEAYIDVTECELFDNDAVKIAKEMKRQIMEKTKLTASAGVSYNKLLAKIGSDLNKPNGLSVLRPQNIEKNIENFSIKKIWGVGKVMQERMNERGIYTFGDLQKINKADLVLHYGDFGSSLYDFCRGIDHRKVEGQGQRKSLTVERTFGDDLKSIYECLDVVGICYAEFLERLKRNKSLMIKNIIIKIKFNDFTQTTYEELFEGSEPSMESFKRLIKFKLESLDEFKPVRLIGMGVKFHSSNESSNQLNFFV